MGSINTYLIERVVVLNGNIVAWLNRDSNLVFNLAVLNL